MRQVLYIINFCPQGGRKSPEQIKVSGLYSGYRLAWFHEGAQVSTCGSSSLLHNSQEYSVVTFHPSPPPVGYLVLQFPTSSGYTVMNTVYAQNLATDCHLCIHCPSSSPSPPAWITLLPGLSISTLSPVVYSHLEASMMLLKSESSHILHLLQALRGLPQISE